MRVVTWNVLYRNREERTDLLVNRLRRVEPDVVLLQETSPEHAETVAEQLGLTMVGCGRSIPDLPHESAPALLCSVAGDITPVGDVIELSMDDRTYAILSRVRLSDGTEAVIGSVHLSHTGQAGRMGIDLGYARFSTGHGSLDEVADETFRTSVATRLEQLMELDRVIAGEQPRRGVLLGGDFNFITYGGEYRRVLELGFSDAWSSGPRLGTRDTILEYNPLIGDGRGVYSERPPGVMQGVTGPLDYTLDFQFFTPGLTAESAWTLGRPDEDDPEWVSDHLGLAADYRLSQAT